MADEARTRSVQVLLASLHPEEVVWEKAIRDPLSHINWPWILDRARAHKLIGILCHRTLRAGIEDRLPQSVQRELITERERSLRHRARVARTLAEVRDLLGRLDCPLFVVKGSVYAHDLYENPTMRRFSDIDVLIPHEKLEAVDRALKQAGYFFWADPAIHSRLPKWFRREAPPEEVPGSESAARRILAAFHRHHLYVLRKDDPRMHVEIHWHVFLPGEGTATSEDLWGETRPTLLEGIEARTLGWEASLLHAAAHAMEQPPTEYRLLHLCDVIQMLVRWREIIDPDKLRDLGRDWGLSRYLTAAVTVAEQVLPGGLPREARPAWSGRNALQAGLLATAGFGPRLVEPDVRGGRTRRLAEYVWREGLWEMALGRLPRTALERVSRAVRVRLPTMGKDDQSALKHPEEMAK